MRRYQVQRFTRTADYVDYSPAIGISDPSEIQYRDEDLMGDFRAGTYDAAIEALPVHGKMVILLGERAENRGIRVTRIA